MSITAPAPRTAVQGRTLTIALAGQPNVGKTTVFNMLTGLNQHVGNWPGKTVEQKTGVFEYKGYTIHLVDLPGTYSLTANSEEERIARDYIIREHPDAVIVMLNAAALERTLYLLAELVMLPCPLVVGLNMVDVARQNDMVVEEHVLAAALGLPVVPVVASRNQGLEALLDAAIETALHPDRQSVSRPQLQPEHQAILERAADLLRGRLPKPYPPEWAALKVLEGDAEITALVQREAPDVWEAMEPWLMQHEDTYLDIAGGRYAWIERLVRAAMRQPKAGSITLTDRVDRIATHPLWGLVVLLGVFGAIFWVTYTLALPVVNWLADGVITPLASWSSRVLAFAPPWVGGLVSDGLIGGVGMVLSFVPILVTFFAVLGFLEDVGYLARAAYVMDRFMHWMGLHGRSFLPLFLGFGCNVPGVMGTRIIEDRRARLLTILLIPLVPCTARMSVITFLAPAFFGHSAPLVVWGLVAVNLLILAVLGVAVNKIAFQGTRTAFIMEIPIYHMPNPRTIALFVWNKTKSFVESAGEVILLTAIAVWWLSYWPGGNIGDSLLARLGTWVAPVGHLLGWGDWRLTVALLTSFLAKENTIATLGVLYGVEAGHSLSATIATVLTRPGALAFLTVQMLFIPCAATIAAIKQEAGGKWAAASIALLLAISLLAGAAVFWIFTWIGW